MMIIAENYKKYNYRGINYYSVPKVSSVCRCYIAIFLLTIFRLYKQQSVDNRSVLAQNQKLIRGTIKRKNWHPPD